MPRVDVVVETMIARTPRVMQIEGIFDLPIEKVARRAWSFNAPFEERPWHVGLIVGPSGAGKTTCARRLFGDAVVGDYDWPDDRAVIDGFPAAVGMKQIVAALNAVGFSSPPSWLRSYSALSNGEKFRATLARALAESAELVVMDEFTSVVDRTVAQIGSAAIAKTIRSGGRHFVAVSCHYDIIDWLQPDWVISPAIGDFQWRQVQRRPAIELGIVDVDRDAWRVFGQHHYLSGSLARQAHCFAALWRSRPVAFSAWMRFPHPRVKNAMREHRAVVLPDFQGVGIGNALSEHLAEHYRSEGYRVFSTTSAPAMVRHRARSKLWRMLRAPSHVPASGLSSSAGGGASVRRLTASFEFVGETEDQTHGFGGHLAVA